MISGNPDWIDIPEHEIVLRGVNGSFLELVAKCVLAKRVVSTGVVGFDVTIRMQADVTCVEATTPWAAYGGIRSLADGLREIRMGRRESITSGGNGFSFSISEKKVGVRLMLFVEGTLTTGAPSRKRKTPSSLTDQCLQQKGGYEFRFAFISSLIDPPYLEDALSQLDKLIADLEAMDYEP